MKSCLAGLNASTSCIDHFHANHNIGSAAVTGRAHEQRAVGQSATHGGAAAREGAEEGQAQAAGG